MLASIVAGDEIVGFSFSGVLKTQSCVFAGKLGDCARGRDKRQVAVEKAGIREPLILFSMGLNLSRENSTTCWRNCHLCWSDFVKMV